MNIQKKKTTNILFIVLIKIKPLICSFKSYKLCMYEFNCMYVYENMMMMMMKKEMKNLYLYK